MGERVVEVALVLVDHEQEPALGMEEALHLLEDAAEDAGQIERRGKGPGGIMEEPEMLERGCGVLGGVGHSLQSIVP